MILKYVIVFLIVDFSSEISREKEEFCSRYKVCDYDDNKVCGIKRKGELFNLKLFDNECELIRFGCQVVNESDAYGIIHMEFCEGAFSDCGHCSNMTKDSVCGIRPHGEGFKVRLFNNKCELDKFNCLNNVNFEQIELYICQESENSSRVLENEKSEGNKNSKNQYASIASEVLTRKMFEEGDNATTGINNVNNGINAPDWLKRNVTKSKNVFIVDGNMFNFNGNINETAHNFFAATHIYDMPIQNYSALVNESTRRMLVRVFGPIMVFKPLVVVPNPVKIDEMRKPLLQSCYHKCPMKCPDTYAPVCGQPGTRSREPSLMFRNHCYMDAAQCKVRWDNNSTTAALAAYYENSFIFCVGETLNVMYRFLPLIRTLQHMGRLKKKSAYRYRIRNMKFLNEYLRNEPKLMG